MDNELDTTPSDSRDPHLDAGHYPSLEVIECKELTGNQAGGSFIISCLMDGKPHSIPINGITNPTRKKMALGNVKAFLAAISGTDPNATHVTLLLGGQQVRKTWSEFADLVTKRNAAKGAKFSCSVTDNVAKLSGQAYKRYSFGVAQ